jgi:hypothetical protein
MPPYPLKYPFGWTGMMLNETPLPDTPIQFNCVAANQMCGDKTSINHWPITGQSENDV